MTKDFSLSSSRIPLDHFLSAFLIAMMKDDDIFKNAIASFFGIKASNDLADKKFINAILDIFFGYSIIKKDKNMNDYQNRYNIALANAANAGALGQFCPRFNNENDFVNYWCPKNTNTGFNGGFGSGFNNFNDCNNFSFNNPNANSNYNAFFTNNSLFSKINKSIDSLICTLPFVNMQDRATLRLIKGVLIGAFIVYLLNNEKSQEFIFSKIIKGSSFLQGFVEEIKERFEDIKAQIEEEQECDSECDEKCDASSNEQNEE